MTLKKRKTHRVLSVCIVISGHDHEITWLFPMRCPMVRRVRPWAVRSPSDGSSENRPMSGVFVRSAVRKAVRNVRWPSENRPKGRSMAVRGRCDGIFGLVRWPSESAWGLVRSRLRWLSDGASDGPPMARPMRRPMGPSPSSDGAFDRPKAVGGARPKAFPMTDYRVRCPIAGASFR